MTSLKAKNIEKYGAPKILSSFVLFRFGIVESAPASADGKVRKVNVRYRNVGEEFDRTTHRGVGGVIVIRRHDEVDIWSELFQAARISDILCSLVYQNEGLVMPFRQ